jgi:hypothetical protein
MGSNAKVISNNLNFGMGAMRSQGSEEDDKFMQSLKQQTEAI